MTDIFGDAEPEDAWDRDDPVPELIDNLIRRVALLNTIQGKKLTARDRLRIRHLGEDLEYIRSRIAEEA